jgi:MFS family permease
MVEQAKSRWPLIITIYCLSIASAMVVSEGMPALGGIAAEFHPRSPAAIGLIMSILALLVAIGGLLTGGLVDRAGDHRAGLASCQSGSSKHHVIPSAEVPRAPAVAH